MLKDLRRIWSEDQYQILGPAEEEGSFYFGRRRDENSYQIFLRSTERVKRKHVKTLLLESEQELFWCCEELELTAQPKKVLEAERSENVLGGYSYNGLFNKALRNLADEVTVVEQILETGAHVLWLIPQQPVGWILSLHGGPESNEGLEIRYGGLYRNLVSDRKAIAILNYRGSTKLKEGISESVWGDWKSAINADFLSLISNARALNLADVPTSVLGVSFGGALALMLGQRYLFQRIVLSSPLLDLSNQKSRGGLEFESWFSSRFSAQDFQNFSYSVLTANSTSDICVCYSKADPVLGDELFLELEKDKKDSLNWRLFPDGAGHSPQTYFDYRERFERLYFALSQR